MRNSWSIILLCNAAALLGQPSKAPAGSDWPMFNHDLAGTRYSPLNQITNRNVASLKQVWAYQLRMPSDAGRKLTGIGGFSEATPIVADGIMYLPAGGRIVALDPETGKLVWSYEPKGAMPSRRGVTYWPGGKDTPPRIVFTAGRMMMALNAKTGQLVPGFGNEGIVDLVTPYYSTPTLFKNMLLVGANVPRRPAKGPAGDSRAYDVRTGAKLWEFHSVPRPGEPGHEVWQGDDWKDRSGVNEWGFAMTADEARDIIYMTFGSPASDYYGGDRKGPDLFGNSVVAVDANTGKYKWHFQVVHHDLWDMDLPPPPGLVDVIKDGKKIPALAQVGKSGWMFILDRVTGKPVFGVEERPVPQSHVPGEQSSPTQPFPIKPAALARNSFKAEDIVTAADTTEEHAKDCRAIYEAGGGLYNAGPFTPFLYHQPGTTPKNTVVFPGLIGGANWGGVAVDPKLGYIFVNTSDVGSTGWIDKQPEGSKVPYDHTIEVVAGGFAGLMNKVLSRASRAVQFDEGRAGGPAGSLPVFWDKKVDAEGATKGESSWPCQKPPWGRLMAVNANTGEFAWSIPLGITEELPAAKQKTGRINMGGPIVTAGGLVFIGASNDRRFRAFDSRTGQELWEVKLDYSAMSVPMTYRGKNGKQYVAVVATGGSGITNPNPSNTESLIVFALP